MTIGLDVNSECRFRHSDELTVTLAARVWDIVAEAIEQRQKASLVLSGGSTPAQLYRVLGELPMPWGEVQLCLSDERWVSLDDPQSNESMLMRELGTDAVTPAIISMAKTTDSLQAEEARIEKALAQQQSAWDLVLLGMGNDGHTASLFPSSQGLDRALNGDTRCVGVDLGDNASKRLTLSKQELLNSKRIILLLKGEEKWQVYLDALAGDDVESMPVRAILHQNQVPVDVYWSLK